MQLLANPPPQLTCISNVNERAAAAAVTADEMSTADMLSKPKRQEKMMVVVATYP